MVSIIPQSFSMYPKNFVIMGLSCNLSKLSLFSYPIQWDLTIFNYRIGFHMPIKLRCVLYGSIFTFIKLSIILKSKDPGQAPHNTASYLFQLLWIYLNLQYYVFNAIIYNQIVCLA